MKKRKPTAYDRGQHELICKALKVSPDPNAPGDTAYEAVCVLMTKLCYAKLALKAKGKRRKELLKWVNKPDKDFNFIKLWM